MRHTRRILAAAGFIGGIAITGAVLAQPAPTDAPPPPPPPAEGPAAQGFPLDLVGPGGPGGPGGPRGHGPMLDFTAIDTNGDKILSRDELTARATARLAVADTNKDGALDRAELVAALPAPPSDILMVFAPNPAEQGADRLLAFLGATDAGKIEIAALADRQVNAVIARFDTDHDGAISTREAAPKPPHKGPRGPGGCGGDERGHRPGPRG